MLCESHPAAEEGGDVDDDGQQDDGEDVGGEAAEPPAALAGLVDQRVENGQVSLHRDGDCHVDAGEKIMKCVLSFG